MVRMEGSYALSDGSEPARVVGLVTGSDVQVWYEGADGELVSTDAQRIKNTVAFHATALLNQLDLVYWTDSKDIRCRFGGVLKRDGKDFATLEAEYSPSRSVPEPARLYFSGVTSLIERVDAFDPKLHMRIGTVYLEGYKDHDGIKFPSLLRQVDRRMRPIGNWYLSDVVLDGEYEADHWSKP